MATCQVCHVTHHSHNGTVSTFFPPLFIKNIDKLVNYIVFNMTILKIDI